MVKDLGDMVEDFARVDKIDLLRIESGELSDATRDRVGIKTVATRAASPRSKRSLSIFFLGLSLLIYYLDDLLPLHFEEKLSRRFKSLSRKNGLRENPRMRSTHDSASGTPP